MIFEFFTRDFPGKKIKWKKFLKGFLWKIEAGRKIFIGDFHGKLKVKIEFFTRDFPGKKMKWKIFLKGCLLKIEAEEKILKGFPL